MVNCVGKNKFLPFKKMNNGVPNFLPGLLNIRKQRTPVTHEVVDVKQRVLFLLCLRHVDHLPHLPLELVVDISKRITKTLYKCFICGKFVEKGREFHQEYILVFCSKLCFDVIQILNHEASIA